MYGREPSVSEAFNIVHGVILILTRLLFEASDAEGPL